MQKLKQEKRPDSFHNEKKKIEFKLKDNGISCSEFNTIAFVQKVTGLDFDSTYQKFFKNYEPNKDLIGIPFNMIMQKRSLNHYLDVNNRLSKNGPSYKVN